MRKNLLSYGLAFLLLVVVFLFFGKAYRELTRYTTFTDSQNLVYVTYQNLLQQINNAAVINPELQKANVVRTGTLFQADSLTILRELALLRSTVRDSVNVEIAGKLDTLVKAELV